MFLVAIDPTLVAFQAGVGEAVDLPEWLTPIPALEESGLKLEYVSSCMIRFASRYLIWCVKPDDHRCYAVRLLTFISFTRSG